MYIDDGGNIETRKLETLLYLLTDFILLKELMRSTLKFAKSRSDLFNLNFVSLDNSTTVKNSTYNSV